MNKKEKLESLQERAFSSICFGLCIQSFLFIIADFNTEIMYYRFLLTDLAYLIGMIFTINFFYKMEKNIML